MTKRLIVGISGASGVIYGVRLLQVLKDVQEVQTHLIISSGAETTLGLETTYEIEQVQKLADVHYHEKDLAAAVSSGSFQTAGMVIAPCSIKTLSGIANSYNENLLQRAADVCLKERRKLVLVPRETPLHQGHLELMSKVSQFGGVILPPFPAFYHQPETIMDLIDQTVGKILDQFDIQHSLFKRWE